MPVPTIISITPAKGHTGGKTLVKIVGTNFRVPVDPPASGLAEPAKPTVQVTFGGDAGSSVAVFSATELYVVTPAHDAGKVTVVVQNLDDNGVAIPGEQASLANGFEYARPDLTVESDLTRVVRQLLRDMKREIIPNVGPPVHTDYDPETGDDLHLVDVASLPSIVILGPDLQPSPAYANMAQVEVVQPDGSTILREAPETDDLVFNLVGASDKNIQALNLMAVVRLFFRRHRFVEIDRDPSNPAAGKVRYPLTVPPGGELKMSTQQNESNVRSFNGSFLIRGVDMESIAGFVNDGGLEQLYEFDTILIDSEPYEPEV